MTMLRGLYGITDPTLTANASLLDAAEAALKGGVALLQYRDKLHEAGDRLRIAQELRRLCHEYGVPLIVNDDLSLAQSIGADGVHLGRDDMPLHHALEKAQGRLMIGVSCYDDLNRALQAEQAGASYVAFGRFFPSRTKPLTQPASIHTLRRARRRLRLPIVAIGGITVENAPSLIDAGADMTAVVHGLFGGATLAEIEATARAFARLF